MTAFRDSSPSEDEAIEAIAAAWLAQKDEGFSAADHRAFDQWRASDRRHEAAAARLEVTWSTLIQLRTFRPDARRHPDRDLLVARRPRPRVFLPLAVAALLAIIVALGVSRWWPAVPPAPSAQSLPNPFYATSTGGFQRVVLDDGSTVELNANSAVQVRYSARERRLELVRGEAQFTVTKNPRRPFWVRAGAVSVRAVGTAFDVRMDPSSVEVLVTEGRVRLDQANALAANGEARDDSSFLDAGHRAVIALGDRFAPVQESLDPPTIRELLAWQAPKLVFLGMPLAQVAAEFNRSNRVQLVIDDPELAILPIGGSFRAENVEAFVRLLAADNHITVARPDADHIVLHKAH
jgi:transmembrane sensor